MAQSRKGLYRIAGPMRPRRYVAGQAMKTSDITDFLESNEVTGALSPLQAAQLLNLGSEGDTGAPALEIGGAPASTTAADTTTTDPLRPDTKTNSTAAAPGDET